jgi:pyridoxal phosphate enzyme (YggS family)
MTIADNLTSIRKRIAGAAEGCGRAPSGVKLVAVSKTKPIGDIIEAINAGQFAFGENYAQELRDKSKLVPPSPQPSPQGRGGPARTIEWHFIGHLQKNKVKYVVPAASWIHTIDSVGLLQEIGKRLSSGQVNCLIEVNIADEESKSGVKPGDVIDLVRSFADVSAALDGRLMLRGLMCMPPVSDDPETSRPYFKRLKSLLDDINSRKVYGEPLTELSMGMTQDFKVAIEEGSTIVRVGTAIFGIR